MIPQKKILITGANGYIGAGLSRYLSNNGYSIDGICYPLIPDDVEWKKYFNHLYNFDIRAPENIERIADNNYDTVIHLVSLDHHQSDGESNFVCSINVIPALNLLKVFANKKRLKKFIYFSTIHVYGNLPYTEISEETEPAPRNIYGLTHLMSEQVCDYYNRNTEINCINVRLSNSYGSPIFKENNCWWLVVNDLCKTAFENKTIILKSDGLPQRDFIHSSDVFSAVEILINTNEKNLKNNTYHISSGETKTIKDLACIIKSIFQARYKQEINIFLPGDIILDCNKKVKNIGSYIIKNTKLRELGFIPKIDFQAGINDLFDYLEQYNEK